jgi:hypothetical protein
MIVGSGSRSYPNVPQRAIASQVERQDGIRPRSLGLQRGGGRVLAELQK